MKKFFYMLLATMGISVASYAANGDTTWVQVHSDVQMPNFGNYDSTIQFPDGNLSYRRIYMIFTLGKYQCPGGSQYCGDWDYTVQNFLMTPNGDTLELSRLITPYANASYARFPWTWRERYIYDVTDFYPVLKDSATIRVHYSGYSGGFTANIKFAFIEGTPARNVLGIDRMWGGSFQYGNASNPIDNNITTQTKTAPANTQSAELKFNITGHGADDFGCSEFCKKYYSIMLNGSQTEQKEIWRDDCGKNNLYPQSGTWVYERGNWCPGALVRTNTHKLNGVTGGNNYSLDVDFEQHTSTGGSQASYTVEGQVFYYGAFNKALDASLEDIIAPTNHEAHFRENPRTAKPLIKVKNMGGNRITSLKIQYGVPGKFNPDYTWQGSLESMDETNIELPELWDLRVDTGSNLVFNAKILEVNGQPDADDKNNALSSVYTGAPQWPTRFVISFRTNASPSVDDATKSETYYNIYDGYGNTIFTKRGKNTNALSTTYTDTIQLGPGVYKIEVKDGGCDGLRFWANPNAGNGFLQVKKPGTPVAVNIPLNGYFNGDFGCEFTQYFNVNWPTEVEDINVDNKGIELYPNPASQSATVSLYGINQVNGSIRVVDAIGRVVINNTATQATETINTSNLANGVYSVVYSDASGIKLQTRLVIAK